MCLVGLIAYIRRKTAELAQVNLDYLDTRVQERKHMKEFTEEGECPLDWLVGFILLHWRHRLSVSLLSSLFSPSQSFLLPWAPPCFVFNHARTFARIHSTPNHILLTKQS